MVCDGLETLTSTGIVDILSFPTYCDTYFYLKILSAIWIILVFSLYMKDRDKFLKGEILSSLGVSSLAVIMIALLGTLVGFIQREVFIIVFVVGILFVGIWIIKKD